MERPEAQGARQGLQRLLAIPAREPLAGDREVVAGQPGTQPSPSDRRHCCGLVRGHPLEDPRDVLTAAEPVEAVVGRVPAVAEHHPIHEPGR